jgi:hypothetical protein
MNIRGFVNLSAWWCVICIQYKIFGGGCNRRYLEVKMKRK